MNEILLVDDSELSLKVLQATLERESYRVLTTTDGCRVTELVRANKPQLVMLDIVMPGCSGLEVLAQLQADEQTAHIPVIMVTARSEADDVRTALDGGAFDYIRKPYNDIEVLARVRSALRVADYQQKLLYLSTHDGLTGLLNHVSILKQLDQTFQETRNEGKSFALIMLDLDHFKTVNDTYGHQFGDHVLQRVGQLIYENFGKYGATGRYGGEEFCIGLRNFDLAMAEKTADTFRKLIAGLAWAEKDTDYRITASLGLAVAGVQDNCVEQLVRRADHALYTAKHGGRNRLVAAKAQ